MPRRSFSRRRGVSRPRRKLVWARATAPPFLITAEANSVASVPSRFDILSQFEASLGASTVGVTVVRTRGLIAVTQPPEAQSVFGRFTMHVDEDADFNGVSANDSAFAEVAQNRDYFMYEPFFAGPSETASSTDLSKRLVDVKSSRKVDELNQTVFLDVSVTTAGIATETLELYFDLSLLLMLP